MKKLSFSKTNGFVSIGKLERKNIAIPTGTQMAAS